MSTSKTVRYPFFPTAASEMRFIGIVGIVVAICLVYVEFKCIEYKSAEAERYLALWLGALPAFGNGVLVLLGTTHKKQIAMGHVSAIRCYDTGILASFFHLILAGICFSIINIDLASSEASKMTVIYSVTKFWLSLIALTFPVHQVVVLWRVKRFFTDSQQQQSK